jgi:hypothetical protein
MTAQLVWKGTPGMTFAHGALGTYTVQTLTNGHHVLQAADGPARNAMPFDGEVFPSLVTAKNRAAEIEDAQ